MDRENNFNINVDSEAKEAVFDNVDLADGVENSYGGAYKNVLSLMRANRSTGDESKNYSHVSMIHPTCSFLLSDRESIDEFWDNYPRAIEGGNYSFGIGEKPQQFVPVLVDIDLKFARAPNSGEKFMYSEKFVAYIITCYQDAIRARVKGVTEDQLCCLWLSKPPYSEVKGSSVTWKNGFHLHFPFLFVRAISQEVVLIPHVLQSLANNPTPDMPDIINGDDFLDRQAVKNSWLMYGSVKKRGARPYLLERVFDSKAAPIDPIKAFSGQRIYDSLQNPICVTEKNWQHLLPRILSIFPCGRTVSDMRATEVAAELQAFVTKPEKPELAVPERQRRSRDKILKDTEIAAELVRMFSPMRAVGHHDWMMVGWALFSVSNASARGQEIWTNFSLKTEDHDAQRCAYEWSRMKNRGTITMGTLRYYAKQDNPRDYAKFLTEQQRKSALDLSERGLAFMFHQHCQFDFIYCKRNWYEFKDHYWRRVDEGLQVQTRMYNTLSACLKTLASSYQDEISEMRRNEEDDTADSEKLSGKAKSIEMCISSLGRSRFISAVFGFCKEFFHDQEFGQKADTDKYLIGFENGVYDLRLDLFRPGSPTDYLTRHMAASYREFSEDDIRVAQVLELFEKIFPNAAVRRYFMDIASEMFVGENIRKQAYFWTGSGNNGKSVIQKLFSLLFGILAGEAPTTVITSRKVSVGGATAELARLGGGMRVVFLAEPSPDEEINPGPFKSLTGNDNYYARDLYESGKDVREIVPMFKMNIVCNDLPKMRSNADPATWDRVRVIPFEATFTLKPPATVEEQNEKKRYPMDTSLMRRLPDMIDALLWILICHRKKPRIEEPEEVLVATREYRSSNDIIAFFIETHVAEDPESSISIHQIYEYYKDFCKVSGAPTKLPMMDFNKNIIKRFGVPNDNKLWPGKRMVEARGAEDYSGRTSVTTGSRRRLLD